LIANSMVEVYIFRCFVFRTHDGGGIIQKSVDVSTELHLYDRYPDTVYMYGRTKFSTAYYMLVVFST
jgi:hypothetical protein